MGPKKHTAATKRKMSQSKPKRPVVAVAMEPPHEVRMFESTRAAGEAGFASSNVTACCKGRTRHMYGHYWRYADDFESVEAVLREAADRPGNLLHPVVSIDPADHKVVRYPSIRATEADGYNYNSVVSVLVGRSRRSGGKFWRYAEDFTSAKEVIDEEASYDESKRG